MPITDTLASSSWFDVLGVIAQDAADSVVIFDDGGRVVSANASGQSVVRSWPDATAPEALRRALGALSPGTSAPVGAATLLRLPGGPEGREGAAGLYRAPVPSRDGALAEIHALLVHDLRAPLQSLIAATEDADTDPAAMREGARQALDCVDQLLSLAGAEDIAALKRAFDPSSTIAELTGALRPLAIGLGVQLIAPPPRGALLFGAEALFRIAAQNMLSNAVRHAGGRVEVALTRELISAGSWRVRLRVSQSAKRFPRGLLAFLSRGDADPSGTNPPGTNPSGADAAEGARLMRAAGRLLGGAWRLDEAPDGAGEALTFSAVFAEESGIAADPEVEPPPADQGGLNGRNILVVEDGRIVRDWAAQTLRRAGAVVATAADARQGLLLAEASPGFDLILSDLTLPEIDGLEFARRLRAARLRAPLPPLIAFSAHDDAATRRACAAAGFAQLLTKPVGARALLACVAETLSGAGAAPPQSAAPAPDLFDAAIVAELLEDLGPDATRGFMSQALDEAERAGRAALSDGLTRETRDMLHSAVGSSGITGLNAVEQALRALQKSAVDDAQPGAACAALAGAVARSRASLDRGAPFAAR